MTSDVNARAFAPENKAKGNYMKSKLKHSMSRILADNQVLLLVKALHDVCKFNKFCLPRAQPSRYGKISSKTKKSKHFFRREERVGEVLQ